MNIQLSDNINLKYMRLVCDNFKLAMQLLYFFAYNYLLTWVVTK